MSRRKQRRESKQCIRNKDRKAAMQGTENDSMISKNMPYWIFAVTLAQRLFYVSQEDSWWTLHPDEIFQSLEIAYSEYFGYGFRAYEYLPSFNETELSPMLRRQQDLGMFSLRSFLFPKLFLVVISCSEWLNGMTGFRTSPFLVCKWFHTTVAATLPLAVYRFSMVLYKSNEIAILCCLAVVASETLSELGTHTLVNSFISPIAFWSLAVLLETMEMVTSEKECLVDSNMNYKQMLPDVQLDWKKDDQDATKGMQLRITTANNLTGTSESKLCSFLHGKLPVINCWCGISTYITQFFHATKQSHNTSSKPERMYVYRHANNHGMYDASTFNEMMETCEACINREIVYGAMQHVNGEYKEVYPREGKCEYPSNGVETGVVSTCRTQTTATSLWFVSDRWRQSVFGFLLGLCMCVRVDLIAFVTFTCLPWVQLHTCTNLLHTLKNFASGWCLAIVFGGFSDFCSYGTWFLSPYQWFWFNIVTSRASLIFGGSNFTGYLQPLFYNNYANLFLLACIILVLMIGAYKKYSSPSPSSIQQQNDFLSQKWHIDVKVWFSIICLFMLYSSHKHKEVRFLHNTVVLFYVLASSTLYRICLWVWHQWNTDERSCVYKLLLLPVFLVAFVCNMKDQCSFERGAKWAYRPDARYSHVNKCLHFLSQRNDVKGLFIDHNIHSTGGYTLLRKDIPIIAKLTFEYFEFTESSRVKLKNRWTRNTSVVLFSKISNIISLYNKLHMLEVLSDKPIYNYYITQNESVFDQLNLKLVRTFGQWKILQRQEFVTTEIFRRKIVDNTNVGYNETLFVYEAGMLLHFGLPDKAEERLQTVLRFNSKDTRVYQMLYEIYSTRKNSPRANSIMKRCFQDIGENECKLWKRPLVLHKEYIMKDG